MTRKDHILKKVNLEGVGLEIGPLHAPMVLKSEAEIYYLDHLSQKDLIKKYARSNKQSKDLADLSAIAEVDYILKDSINKTVAGRKFDYVVASHVIEHIPDMTSWLRDIASILKPDGILALAIPDKRFTFDITRNISRPADIIGAYVDKLTKAYTSLVYDHTVEFKDGINAGEVWSNPQKDHRKHKANSLRKKALEKSLENGDPNKYIDVHCNVFTPFSFVEVLKELIFHGFFDYEIAYFHETAQNDMEFHVNLKKSNKSQKEKFNSLPKIKKPQDKFDLFRQISVLES